MKSDFTNVKSDFTIVKSDFTIVQGAGAREEELEEVERKAELRLVAAVSQLSTLRNLLSINFEKLSTVEGFACFGNRIAFAVKHLAPSRHIWAHYYGGPRLVLASKWLVALILALPHSE